MKIQTGLWEYGSLHCDLSAELNALVWNMHLVTDVYLLPLGLQRDGTVKREIHQSSKHSSNHTSKTLPQGNNERWRRRFIYKETHPWAVHNSEALETP